MNDGTSLRDGLDLHAFRFFRTQTLVVESPALKGNPLGDPSLRRNPVLVPLAPAPADGYPVVLLLSGLFGNGTYSFNLKSREPGTAEVLDACATRGEAPAAVYVFCDAMTAWGGSQFLNSRGTGRYEDYVCEDLVGAIRAQLPVSPRADRWCVSGGSSGGYGALHLASRHPNLFGLAASVAPDSFFEASLLPDLYTAAATLRSLGVPGAREELESGRLRKRKDWHAVANAVAMGLCYAPDENGGIEFPLDFETGLLNQEIWMKWKSFDPVVFLTKRADQLKRLNQIYLDVGRRDQFQLLYGARQVRDLLLEQGVACEYSEFEGTHFDIGDRRPRVWKWLKSMWESN